MENKLKDMEYQSSKDIDTFLGKNPEMVRYKEMFLEFHKASNFNLFFLKLRKNYFLNKNDKSILNELKTAYNFRVICGFHPIFMPEKDFGTDLKKLKQGSYMIFQMPEKVSVKDLARIKKPDILVFFKGEYFYVEIKTIEGRIKNPQKVLQKIDNSISQIETFGQGLIQIFCENISNELIENFDSFESEIIQKIEKNKDIMGVLITYYDLFSSEQFSENQSKKVYKKKTKYISNNNFKKILVRNQLN